MNDRMTENCTATQVNARIAALEKVAQKARLYARAFPEETGMYIYDVRLALHELDALDQEKRVEEIAVALYKQIFPHSPHWPNFPDNNCMYHTAARWILANFVPKERP